MSHLDEGQIHALLDGELTPAERSQAEEHLGGCAECRQLLVEDGFRDPGSRANHVAPEALPVAGLGRHGCAGGGPRLLRQETRPARCRQ